MLRREVLTGGVAAASLIGLGRRASADVGERSEPRRRARAALRIDALGGLDYERRPDGSLRLHPQIADAARQRRIDLASMTIAEPGNGPDRFAEAVGAIADWDQVIAENPEVLRKIKGAEDLALAGDGRIGVIYNFQDTAALEGDAKRVRLFKTLGVRVLQLTYNKRNLAGDGCLERANGGLSDFGREVIAAMNAEHVLLDLSHAGQRTIAEGIAASSAPPAITHSGCRALVDYPRNTHDAEMRALAAKGGVFGLYLMPFLRAAGQPGREDLLRHLEHALNVCGEDHTGIGTDQFLRGRVVNEATRQRQRDFFERRQRLGIAAPGEAADVLNHVDGYNDVERFDRIALDLSRRGWSGARIDKVLGGNFARLFREVWRS
jgi:membrane dipeptidase